MTDDRDPCWNRGDLFAALDAYLAWLEARPELSPFTRRSHRQYAGMFVRWLYAEYWPRGFHPRPDPIPHSFCLTPADLESEFQAYEAYLKGSPLEPRGVPTYTEGASLFLKWLGRTSRRSRRPSALGQVIPFTTNSRSEQGKQEPPVNWRKTIKLIAGKRGGQPTIRGLRITVADVLSYLAAGMSEDQILADFPDLRRADIRAALAYAADRERLRTTLLP